MPQPLNYLKETASQTAGPYVHIGLIPAMAGFDIFEKNFSNVLVTPNTKGERITLEGKVLDGTGTPLRDVLLEIWQANAAGRYNHPADRSSGALEGEGTRRQHPREVLLRRRPPPETMLSVVAA